MTLSPSNFPKRLLEARKEHNLTQATLAKLAKLTPAHVSHFEAWDGVSKGDKKKGRSPSVKNLCAIANALRVPADQLLS